MKRRYAFDPDSGLLVDRDGNPLGRVVGLTIDTTPLGGKGGGSSVSSSTTVKDETTHQGGGAGEPSQRPIATSLEGEAIDRVWAYYLKVIPSKRRLDAKRRRIIREALVTIKTTEECDLAAAEARVKAAVLGLSRSPHHRGENAQKRHYLEIRYALKGIGDESDDERIEKAVEWGVVHDPSLTDVDPDKVQRWLDDVRYFIAKQAVGSSSGRGRAIDAFRKLTAVGFKVVKLDRAPWARVTRGGGNT